ncbi:phosphatase PAP2 family protein [Manganibacter manganicus]|uniref:Phosphoesterase n=1 Tax=Manganibacter manganicus TaxID=1873176 RepID=A0A1V8RNZ2_9HYPH|nr:phosphatase PAP2 family protein [Pseudaminobacter manganicus]OQM74843.1 phosphoesterase [Pseudaminobacter manganicus]
MKTTFGKVEPNVLIAWAVVAGGLLGFVACMQIAGHTIPPAFDSRILLALRVAGQPDQPLGPFWLPSAVRDITSLGSTIVLMLAMLSVVAYLLLIRRGASAVFVFVAIVSGQMLASLLKYGVGRPRPEIVSHLVAVHTPSFPSGHAMVSAVTYLTLGALAAHFLPHRLAKVYVMGLALLTTLLVGLSRLYLGVHWPSDVLGGWCAGFAWAMLCWLAARWLQEKGRKDA